MMVRSVRLILPLVLILGLVVLLAAGVAGSLTRRWTERDLQLRVKLAAGGVHDALVNEIRKSDRRGAQKILVTLTHDERIMAAAACGPLFESLVSTPDFPGELACGKIRGRTPAAGREIWSETQQLSGGSVHVSVVPLGEAPELAGFLVLVHDLAFAERRGRVTLWLSVLGFVVLAVAASLTTILVDRVSWRSWTAELRRTLRRGDERRGEFQPLLRDVRELVANMVAEQQGDRAGIWSAERLRQTLSKELQGERIVIVANREPYIHDRGATGIHVLRPASGLVTALEPIMRACSGTWIAHGSGSADRETADARGRIRVPPGDEEYTIRRVWLSKEEEQGYYFGFSNEGLWPLCHLAHNRPEFRQQDWKQYEAVNRKFVDAVCEEVDSPNPIVLIQDYHFALAPKMLRERLPRATILTFWHIPWPNAERFGICPWEVPLLEGLLGSSIVGFHTQQHCINFLEAVDRYLESRIDREQQAVVQQGRATLVRAYPISIEWPETRLEGVPPAAECRAKVFADLDLDPTTILGVGIDRLDYTKGIEERLLAVERMLERFPTLRGRFTFAQLAAPSRTSIGRYRDLNVAVEQLAARINERFGKDRYRPIVLLREHHEAPTVFRFYRAADLCYVSSLHDGMNLVAKEFVAARDDERGVLILSRFTGASRELTEALLVNPYDLEEASSALAAAVTMSAEEQRARMRAMRSLVAERNVYRWAGRMLVDAARLRRSGRVSDRLAAATGSNLEEA